MKWVLYTIAALATVLAGFLWVFVLSQVRGSAAAAGAAATLSAPSGRLPVVPVLRAGYGPGDPIYEAQAAAFRERRLVCAGGWLARPLSSGGAVVYTAIETDRGRLPCP